MQSKRGTMRLKFHLRIYLLLFLSSTFILACSQAVVESQKETSESSAIPEFKKNDIEGRDPTAPKPKQTTIPPEKPLEAIKDVTPLGSPLITTQDVKEELDKMKGEIEALKKDVSFLKTKAAISLSPPPKIPPSQAKVLWAYVNLREGPGIDHKVIGNVKRGASLTILEEKKGWLHVQLEDGTIAWMTKDAISEAPKTPASPPSSKAVVPTKSRSPM